MAFYTKVLTTFFARFIPITFVPFHHAWLEKKSQTLVFLSEIKLAIIEQLFDTLNGCSKMSHLDLDKKKAGELQSFISI